MNITPHPIILPPTKEQLDFIYESDGLDAVSKFLEQREEVVRISAENPLEHGFRMPSWDKIFDQLAKWDEVFAFGGNGATKSRLGAWVVCQCILNNPGHRMYCFAQDDDASKQIQQRYVYDLLPPRFKEKKISSTGYLKYTRKNGFTESNFIIDLEDGTEPRECHFFTYSQYRANRVKFEGYEYGSRDPQPFTIPYQRIFLAGKWFEMPERELTLNVGAWLDEYLESGELYDTLLYRITRRSASILTTFTPIDHMTPFVAGRIKNSYVTQTISTNPRVFYKSSEPKKVEWVREKKNSKVKGSGIGMVFMPSEHNPWAGFDSMVKLHSHKELKEKLVRFHGIPGDLLTSMFPLFSTDVHVIDERPKMVTKVSPHSQSRTTHTAYHVVDPAGNRNYCALWGVVDPKGYATVLREWPDRGTFGLWAEYRKDKWMYGPAAKKLGYNVEGYIKLYRDIEDDLGITVFERIGDSRFFAKENEFNFNLFESFMDEGMDFLPSDGGHVKLSESDAGIADIDEWFYYNPDVPIDAANCPILKIHKSCGNLIESIQNWNGEGKKDEALKDWIDLLRYFRRHNGGLGPDYVDLKANQQQILTKAGY